jgi:hypothetical protein
MDIGVGNWRWRKKLEKVKHSTQEAQAVQQIESELSNIAVIQRVYQKHAERRGALRSFYQSKSMINQQRFCQLHRQKFQEKENTSSRNKRIKQWHKPLLIFVSFIQEKPNRNLFCSSVTKELVLVLL